MLLTVNILRIVILAHPLRWAVKVIVACRWYSLELLDVVEVGIFILVLAVGMIEVPTYVTDFELGCAA